MDAPQGPRQLQSVAAAVITNSIAQDANISPDKGIFVEPINKASEEWINIIVANGKNANNPTYKKIVKLYQTQITKDLYKKYYPAEIPAWDITLK